MDEIILLLRDKINSGSGKRWCEDLMHGDDDCKRLGICLSIELRDGNEILNNLHLNEIFNEDDYKKDKSDNSYPRKWFFSKLVLKKRVLCSRDGCIVPSTEFINSEKSTENYVTFISFFALKKYYLDHIGYYISTDSNSYDDVSKFIRMFPNFLDYVEYFGGFGIAPVWVTTEKEANRCLSLDTDKNNATNIMNNLGLLPDLEGVRSFPYTGNMYFKVNYPKTIKLTLYQPTSLNKNWKDAAKDLYLSYIKDDKFGRTYASDSSGRMAKELIHEPFKCRNEGLMIEYVDKFDVGLDCDKSKILMEGLNRLML